MKKFSDKFCSETPTRMSLYYNVTTKGVRVTIVAVEKQYMLHILSVCL